MKNIGALGCSLVVVSGVFGAAAAGCGGGGTASGASLSVLVHPSDRGVVNTRRLESLARQFDEQYTCTATDTITVSGVASRTYSVDGCGHMVVYQLHCRSGAYSQICDWMPVAEDLLARAATDMSCSPDTMDLQPAPGVVNRTVMGCGYAASYTLQCQGICTWQLTSPVTQTGVGAETTNGVVTTDTNSAYISQ